MDYVVVQHTTANIDHAKADAEFKKQFLDNKFCFVCSVCDRLWFEKDLRPVPRGSIGLLATEFPGEDVSTFRACNTCYKSLAQLKVPQRVRVSGVSHTFTTARYNGKTDSASHPVHADFDTCGVPRAL